MSPTTVVPVYEPKPVIQGDGSVAQWRNCTCASGACQLDRDTEGAHRTTGKRVRELTGDFVGGNNLDQIDDALKEGWPPQDHMDNRRREAFDDAVNEIASGRGGEIQGNYKPVIGTAYPNGCPGFDGNHAWFWNEVRVVKFSNGRIDYVRSKAKVWDPLWDGRRKGIPGYNAADPKKPSLKLRWISLGLLRKAAGALEMANGQALGDGYCYIGYTRVTGPADTVPVAPPVKYGENSMIVAGGLTLTSEHVVSVKQGQPFYRTASINADVIAKSAEDHSYDYFGYGAPGWYSVLIVTGNFADGVKRPVIAFCPRAAGPVTKKS